MIDKKTIKKLEIKRLTEWLDATFDVAIDCITKRRQKWYDLELYGLLGVLRHFGGENAVIRYSNQ